MIIFAYNFPHWKSQNGLINLVANGFRPELVVLQNKKTLSVPQSLYRVVPKGEYLLDTKTVCEMLSLPYVVMDHNDFENPTRNPEGLILGARILSKDLINRFRKGIINLHPGILPGNRGLDNLKHSISRGLPIGVTAHYINERIDMGMIIQTVEVPVYPDDNIRDVYIRQRNAEQSLMIGILKNRPFNLTLCPYSPKFGIVSREADAGLEMSFEIYKNENISSRVDLREPSAECIVS